MPEKRGGEVNPSHLSTQLSCPRDFLCCRVSPRQASLSPDVSRRAPPLLIRRKDPTTVALFETHHATVTPRLASLERTDASFRRADQLAALRQGPPVDQSVPPWGQTAGVGPWETEDFSDPHEKTRRTIFCIIRSCSVKKESVRIHKL